MPEPILFETMLAKYNFYCNVKYDSNVKLSIDLKNESQVTEAQCEADGFTVDEDSSFYMQVDDFCDVISGGLT